MISIMIRTTVMFLLVIFTIRLMGKKSLGEFQPSDLVSIMLISNLTSIVIEAPELPLLYSAVPILLIMCYEIFMSVLVQKNDKIAQFAAGKTMVLIKNGIIDQKIMQQLRFNTGDILEAMRSKDIFYLEEVGMALIETTGGVSVYPDPYISKNIKKAQIPPLDVITDGKKKKENMDILCLSENDITKILNKEKMSVDNVLLLLVDGDGKYNIVRKEV